MTTGKNFDGTIDVRVVLTVRVDPEAWAADVMQEHPDEVLVREIRKDVKAYVRNLLAENEPTTDAVRRVDVQGVYS